MIPDVNNIRMLMSFYSDTGTYDLTKMNVYIVGKYYMLQRKCFKARMRQRYLYYNCIRYHMYQEVVYLSSRNLTRKK